MVLTGKLDQEIDGREPQVALGEPHSHHRRQRALYPATYVTHKHSVEAEVGSGLRCARSRRSCHENRPASTGTGHISDPNPGVEVEPDIIMWIQSEVYEL